MRPTLTFKLVVLSIVVVSMSCLAQQPPLVVAQRILLTSREIGARGWIEVLMDSRLTPDVQKRMWATGDWEFEFPKGTPLHASFESRPPMPALLRIVGPSGQETGRIALERPLAEISETKIFAGSRILFVSQDFSIGFGSYAGVSTGLLQIVKGELRWIESTDAKSKRVEKIWLQRALKSDWKVASKNGTDILSIYCRPNTSISHRFEIHFVRYRFERRRWVKYERVKQGIWESDEGFPPALAFPSN